MMGSIMLTWMQGSDLDHNCKKWRLFADFANDFAMCLELSGPLWPKEWFQYILCGASVSRALVGVAGGWLENWIRSKTRNGAKGS